MKKFSQLTEEEREGFSNEFYSLYLSEFKDDRESPYPWGCPWDWSGDSEAVTPEEWFEINHNDIESAINQEEE